MKLTKSLLLASAAGLAAVATASAADLPSKKAAPVEYVKVCPTYGPGFFYIPGSDTCLKVGGNFWAEANWSQPYQRANNTLGTRTSLAVSLDARTNTEYGLVRTVVTPQISYRTGSDNSGSANREGLNFNGSNGEGIGAAGKQTQFNAIGYVQFGGFTAGHMGSFFDVVGFNANIGIEGRDQRDLDALQLQRGDPDEPAILECLERRVRDLHEQLLGEEQGQGTDLFAVGGIVYFALTGRQPFSGGDGNAIGTERGARAQYRLDITDRAQLERLAAQLGGEPIDVLFCNAGIIDLGNATMVIDPFLGLDAARALKDSAERLTGKQVSLLAGEQRVAGLCRGINDRGALLLETDGKLQPWFGGVVRIEDLA